jgi:tripartite-type tricarboxylate transporter receptor subunit TctC
MKHKGHPMIDKRSLVLSLAASALALAASLPSSAQTYPDKPIRIIVTVAAGGPMDTIARFVATQMQARLGQPVIVENLPARAPPSAARRSPPPSPTAAP